MIWLIVVVTGRFTLWGRKVAANGQTFAVYGKCIKIQATILIFYISKYCNYALNTLRKPVPFHRYLYSREQG